MSTRVDDTKDEVNPERLSVEDHDPSTSSVDAEAIPQQDIKQADVPPDGGYGWVCVACVFLINAHTWGVNSVSLFFGPSNASSNIHSPMAFSLPIIWR
jgi:hypothetical protein